MWSPGISSPCQTANSRLVADVASTLASERRRAAYSLEDSRPCDPTDQSTAGVVDPPSPGIRATPRDVGTDGRSLGSDRTLAPEARSAMAKYRGGASVEPPAPAHPEPPLSEDQQRAIREEWRRSPRGATKLYQSLAKQGTHIPKMQIYRFGKTQGWVVANPRKQRKRRYVRYERAHSGSLLHGDFHRSSETSPHCILWEDDASRMVMSGGEFGQATAEAAIATLTEALGRAAEWGVEVREVNTAEMFMPALPSSCAPGFRRVRFVRKALRQIVKKDVDDGRGVSASAPGSAAVRLPWRCPAACATQNRNQFRAPAADPPAARPWWSS